MGKGVEKVFKNYKMYGAMVLRSPFSKMGAMETGGASGATDIANFILYTKM